MLGISLFNSFYDFHKITLLRNNSQYKNIFVFTEKCHLLNSPRKQHLQVTTCILVENFTSKNFIQNNASLFK